MSPISTSGAGSASGWSIHEYPPGSWHWLAYGPNGGAQGVTSSKARAETLARAETENLKRPRSSES